MARAGGVAITKVLRPTRRGGPRGATRPGARCGRGGGRGASGRYRRQVGGGHVPAALDPRRAALARCQDQPEGGPGRAGAALFGGEVQAADGGEAGGPRQVGHHEGGGAAAQRLLHAPQEIGAVVGGDEDEPFRPGERGDAAGIGAVGDPCGGDPEHRAGEGPRHQHRPCVPRRAAALVQPPGDEGERAGDGEGRARDAGEGGHGGRVVCLRFVLKGGGGIESSGLTGDLLSGRRSSGRARG